MDFLFLGEEVQEQQDFCGETGGAGCLFRCFQSQGFPLGCRRGQIWFWKKMVRDLFSGIHNSLQGFCINICFQKFFHEWI